MTEEIWKLTVVDVGGNEAYVLGPAKRLRPVYLEWRDETYNDAKRVVLEGYNDDAVRTPLEIAYDREQVRLLILSRYCP